MTQFVAITRPGKEFIYRSDTAHQVPARSAARILDALNRARYSLRDGEIWHLYTADGPALDIWQCFRVRSGHLYEGTL